MYFSLFGKSNLIKAAHKAKATLKSTTVPTTSPQTCKVKGLMRAVHLGTMVGGGLTKTYELKIQDLSNLSEHYHSLRVKIEWVCRNLASVK